MLNKRILIAGDVPYVDTLYALCAAGGYKADVYHIEELDDPAILDQMIKDATRCDLFIESLNDAPASKLWLIEGVEPNLKERTPILSHCLCTTATEVASWCEYPQRVIGYSLLPPITAPTLVEFTPALQADFNSTAQAREFFDKLGFEIVRVPDTPAMVRARIICCLINEAAYTLDQQVASAEDIDLAVQLSANLPLGPLSWADEIGLDVVLGTLNALYDFWRDERYHPSPLIKQKVLAGHLGKKTGRGFFIEPLGSGV